MRIAVGMFKHETNTFSPIPTRWEHFGANGPLFGDEAYRTYRHSGYSMAGLLEAAEAIGGDVFIPIAARALPSAPVEKATFERIADGLCTAARQCDVMLLDLHGAMVAEHCDDGEGELLARIRAVAPNLPIAAALDSHANMTQRMLDHATIMTGYETYPHLDMVETGRLAGHLFREALAGRLRPKMALARVPMLPNMLCCMTTEQPMARLIEAARAEQRDGVLCVRVFTGFPLSDTEHTGLAVLAVADGDQAKAEAVATRVADLAWSLRSEFARGSPEPLDDAISRAKAFSGGPVILADISDNCNSGGTQDAMDVIAAALDHGLTGILAGPIVDKDAVSQAVSAGVGAQLTLDVGGKSKIPALREQLRPLRLSGIVRSISDGRFVVEGPVFTGMPVNLGRTIVLECEHVTVVISEDRVEALDPLQFRFVGLDPARFRYLVLKSKVQFRPAFMPIAKAAIECSGPGVASMDLDAFTWRKLRRPTFPIDRANSWQ